MLNWFSGVIRFLRIPGLYSALIKVISWITPQGLHLIVKFLNCKTNVQVQDVSITEESDEAFSAVVKLVISSKNKEALTTVKTEITNKPLHNLKNL